MKNLLTIALLFLTIFAQAQDVVQYQVVSYPDTTYQLLETITADGASTPYSSILYPKTALGATEFIQFMYQRSKAMESNQLQYEEIALNTKEIKDKNVAVLDTIAGSGTYAAAIVQDLIQSLAGTWVLTATKGTTVTKTIVAVSGNVFMAGDITGTISGVNLQEFTLTGYIANVLTFSLKKGVWSANDKGTKYALRK